MDVLTSEALEALEATLTALLPENLRSTLLVIPQRAAPTGLGGFVGVNQAPVGDILGRQIAALVQVTVRATNANQLGAAVTTATKAILGIARATLLAQGIQRLALDEVAPAPDGTTKQSILTFRVLYEFLKRPSENEGLIREIPLKINVGVHAPSLLLASLLFDSDPLSLFDIIDDPGATTSRPSQWVYNANQARVEQSSSIRGGPQTADVTKSGSYLLLKTSANRPPVQDMSLTITVRSEAEGGLGLVFRWQDPANFYFFLMDRQLHMRVLGRKLAGNFQNLSTPAIDTVQGYERDSFIRLRLIARGASFRMFLNDGLVLEGEDSSLPSAGRVGLLARNNNKAYFYNIDLVQL